MAPCGLFRYSREGAVSIARHQRTSLLASDHGIVESQKRLQKDHNHYHLAASAHLPMMLLSVLRQRSRKLVKDVSKSPSAEQLIVDKRRKKGVPYSARGYLRGYRIS